MVKRIVILIVIIFVVFKLVSSYRPVEVIPVHYDEVEDKLAGEFLLLRDEETVTSSVRGVFQPVKEEGERVAKNAVVGYLEVVGGTSLEKKSSVPIKAPSAGVLSYCTDGLEQICAPEMWTQLDLSKIDLQALTAYSQTLKSQTNNDKVNEDNGTINIEAGQSLFKIVDNLSPCYFYLMGTGAYPEKVKKEATVSVRLDKNKEKLYKGTVVDIVREAGTYRVLIKVIDDFVGGKNRQVTGELLVSSYKGIVLPEKVLLYKDNQYGVYVFQKGRARWKEVERIAQFDEKVVVSGLEEGDWLIANPEKVQDGQWVWRMNN